MKTLNLEQMETINGGQHSLRAHLACVALGLASELAGPLAVIATMTACYALSQ
jgi:hypothetical protein